MDINYFLAREQVERMRSERASCDSARAAHDGLAELYRGRVERHRRGLHDAAGIGRDQALGRL